MPFPKTESELAAQGYVFENRARCRAESCQAEIEWWLTPKGKRIPLDPCTMEPHWSTCPESGKFRRDK
jgi:hypothetical protein